MSDTRFMDLLKIIGLGEELFLALDVEDPIVASLVDEIIINFILINLNKQQRLTFYQLVEEGGDLRHAYRFLSEQIPNLDEKLTSRIKSELRGLLTK